MNVLDQLTELSVMRAIERYDEVGEKVFLDSYGYAPARDYFLIVNNRRYPSKAIAGIARGFARPDLGPLKHYEFSGGLQTVCRRLLELGFRVEGSDGMPKAL